MDEKQGTTERCCGRLRPGTMLSFAVGLGAGAILTAAAVWALMPRMMIDVEESRLSFDETVLTLQEAVARRGWVVAGTRDMRKSLARHGRTLERRVKIIELCHPDYARSVLRTNRELSTLMPCAIGVWEGDDGRTYVSKTNTGLMGRMFGGNVAEVMGGPVAEDEEAILSAVVR